MPSNFSLVLYILIDSWTHNQFSIFSSIFSHSLSTAPRNSITVMHTPIMQPDIEVWLDCHWSKLTVSRSISWAGILKIAAKKLSILKNNTKWISALLDTASCLWRSLAAEGLFWRPHKFLYFNELPWCLLIDLQRKIDIFK